MNPTDDDTLSADELRAKLNLETGKITWPELQRHFARGVVIVVTPETDLVDVAVAFAEDNTTQIERWILQGQIRRASDADALRWQNSQTLFWAVVVKPWVLVQELSPQ